MTHTTGAKCLFDTDTQEIIHLPNIESKFFIGGKWFDCAETIAESFEFATCIVPVFCLSLEKIKKRSKARIISGQTTFEFFNVERINGDWVRNDIEAMENRTGYFAFLERNAEADNGVIIKKVRTIAKINDMR